MYFFRWWLLYHQTKWEKQDICKFTDGLGNTAQIRRDMKLLEGVVAVMYRPRAAQGICICLHRKKPQINDILRYSSVKMTNRGPINVLNSSICLALINKYKQSSVLSLYKRQKPLNKPHLFGSGYYFADSAYVQPVGSYVITLLGEFHRFHQLRVGIRDAHRSPGD